MMTGLEAIGLALAIFPVVVEVVECYKGSLTSRDIKHLVESLKNSRQLFRNSIEIWLRSIVSAQELKVLLDDLEGDAWRQASLKQQVSQQLGTQAESLFTIVQDIHKTIFKLQEKLPTQDTNRLKKVVKCFVHGPSNSASLERLRVRISDFRELTQDSLKLAPPHNTQPRALQDLDCVRGCASGLHDALRSSWKCTCAGLHPANIQLDSWDLFETDESDKDYLNFSLVFPHAQHEHRMTAKVPLLRSNRQGWPPPVVPSKLGTSATGSTTASHTVPSIGSSVTLAASQGSGSSAVDKIDDFCAVVKKPPDPATCVAAHLRLGSISDSSGRDYHIFKDSQRLSNTKSGRMGDFFADSKRHLNNKLKVKLALKLAWAVLQVSSTGWLMGRWTKENVHLIMSTPSEPRAYITHGFESQASSPSQSSTLSPKTVNDIAAQWIRNTTLFALGVFMLEVGYMSSIEDLASPDEKGHSAEFLTAMRLRKVVQNEMGIAYAEAVNACLNPDPAHDDDAQGRPKNYAKFAESMWSGVIGRLDAAAAVYGI